MPTPTRGTGLAAVVAALLGCASGTQSDAAFDWVPRAPLPVPRTELAVAAVGGKIYAMGGSSGSTLARVDEYDPATDAWTRKADMRLARRNFPAAVIGGKIYVGPGMSWTDPNAVTYVAGTEVYDPATDTWMDRAGCPFAPAVNAVRGNLFFGGGGSNGRFHVVVVTPGGSATYGYDPGMDAWSAEASSPVSFSQVAGATLGTTLYLFASPTEAILGSLASYDPTGDFWVSLAGLPSYSRSAFVASGGKLYSLGGITGKGISSYQATDAVHEYDPAPGTWKRRGSIPAPREYAGAVELGGHVFLVGGDVLGAGGGLSGTPSAAVDEGIPR